MLLVLLSINEKYNPEIYSVVNVDVGLVDWLDDTLSLKVIVD